MSQQTGRSGTGFGGAMAIVTGAGSGIGLAIAEAFHADGARVALGDLNQDTVDRAAARIGGDRVFAAVVDVRDETSVRDFFAGSEHALGPVTITVANAGIFPNCPVLDMSVTEWDRVMETNLRGTLLTCQAGARSMVAGGRPGKIVTISSGAHASARLGGAHYCASKAGIVMFTKVLAMELAERRINVNCVAPGYINTKPDIARTDTDFQNAMLRNIPLGRFGTPAEVAQTVLYLASSAADYVTGEVFAVNGGAFAGRAYLPFNKPEAR
jgi:NAD(P)-dependent dehydrogenase (short-subunit alcohol dehydrogenase family)